MALPAQGVGKFAWLNGVFVSADEAQVSPFDRGFLFADGVYEVAAVYGGRLIDLERHLDRLERSLRELGYPEAAGPAGAGGDAPRTG